MDKKQAIIAITQAHLAAHGFHATGVEQLAVAANITKRTLYNHFGSKEALLLETMRHRDEEWRQAMQAFLQAALPENALLAYVDYLAHWLKQDDFYGCYFINACAEYADPAHDMHKLAAAHKKRIFEALHQRVKTPRHRQRDDDGRRLDCDPTSERQCRSGAQRHPPIGTPLD